MARDHLLAIDQGTTSTRAVVYDNRLQPIGQAQAEVPPTYPQSGWVEHRRLGVSSARSVRAGHPSGLSRPALVALITSRRSA